MLTEAQTAFTIAATDAATSRTSRSSMNPGVSALGSDRALGPSHHDAKGALQLLLDAVAPSHAGLDTSIPPDVEPFRFQGLNQGTQALAIF
jgi:hypothetical protein